MYHIIGSDGRQYGPATLEQLQRWVAEGRVNGRTLVQPAGAGAWRPLDEWTGQAAPAVAPPPALPPPLPLPMNWPPHGAVEDDARVGWLRRHFRRHERRSPGDYLWRVTLEAFLIAMAVAILLSLWRTECQTDSRRADEPHVVNCLRFANSAAIGCAIKSPA